MTDNIRVEIITPEKAKHYLSLNVEHNRPISHYRVMSYAKEMMAGKWLFNGDAIRFDSNGNLIDGQHRLQAVVRSNIPIKFLVIEDLDSSIIQTIDIGRKRTVSDILYMQYGISQSSRKAAISKSFLIPFSPYTFSCFKVQDVRTVSESEIINIYFENKEGIDFSCLSRKNAGFTRSHSKELPCIVASVVARAYYFENHKRLEEFANVVLTNYNERGRENFAAVALFNYLNEMRITGKRDDDFVIFSRTQKALSAFLRYEPLQFLKYHAPGYLKIKDGLYWRVKTDKPFIEKWEQQQREQREKEQLKVNL